MAFARFVWNRLRLANRLPGSHAIFRILSNWAIRDGATLKIPLGPAAGLRWKHYRHYQPWMAIGLYEPEVAQEINQQLAPGDIFFDIGANAGYYTLVGARAVGNGGKVVAFDPVPVNASTIEEQVSLNRLEHVCQVEAKAIADFSGLAALAIPRRNANAHLANIEAPHIDDHVVETIQVPCITLDECVIAAGCPALVKIDIEGAEVQALLGAQHLMNSSAAPTFLITAHSELLAARVRGILSGARYKFLKSKDTIFAIPPSRQH